MISCAWHHERRSARYAGLAQAVLPGSLKVRQRQARAPGTHSDCMDVMHRHTVAGRLLLVSLAVGVTGCATPVARSSSIATPPSESAVAIHCTRPAAAQLRTILYFGLARPAGTVTEAEWQAFVGDEVTPRFPDGLTMWEVDGQWRRGDGQIIRERSKVLLLVHGDTPAARAAIQDLIAGYERAFEQESVLWETTPVCAVF